MITRYIALGSVPALAAELAAHDIVSKRRVHRNGQATGGTPYRRGALYDLLANRLYCGDIVHKGVAHPGEQEAIVDQLLWDEVQALLARNRVARRHRGNANDPSLLAGMVRDEHGRRMSPCHSGKADRRYRYYVSVVDDGGTLVTSAAVTRVAAGEAEAAVIEGFRELIKQPLVLIAALGELQRGTAALFAELPSIAPSALNAMFMGLDLQVVIDGSQIKATLDRQVLASRLGVSAQLVEKGRCDIPMLDWLCRTGHEVRLAIAPQAAGTPIASDGGLVTLIVKAHQARDLLVGQKTNQDTISALSHRHLTRLARLAYLAPEIIIAIMKGRQPKSMTSRSLLRVSNIPLDWNEERKMFGV